MNILLAGIFVGLLVRFVIDFVDGRRIKRLEDRLDRIIKATPALREHQVEILSDDIWIYGKWREHRARRNERTGYSYYWSQPLNGSFGFWSRLGLGYETEFVPNPRGLMKLLK